MRDRHPVACARGSAPDAVRGAHFGDVDVVKTPGASRGPVTAAVGHGSPRHRHNPRQCRACNRYPEWAYWSRRRGASGAAGARTFPRLCFVCAALARIPTPECDACSRCRPRARPAHRIVMSGPSLARISASGRPSSRARRRRNRAAAPDAAAIGPPRPTPPRPTPPRPTPPRSGQFVRATRSVRATRRIAPPARSSTAWTGRTARR